MVQRSTALLLCIQIPRHVRIPYRGLIQWLTQQLTYLIGGLKIEGEDEAYDFGSGAGFYVDAIKELWKKGYNMYSYITKELPEALFSSFKELDSSNVSITGHSMGGHGALTLVGCHGRPIRIWLTLSISFSKTLACTSPFLLLRPLPIR